MLRPSIVKCHRRHMHAAHTEVNARRQTHRRRDHAQLAGFCQRLDDTRTGRIRKPAVVKGHAFLQQVAQLLATDSALFMRQFQGFTRW